MCPPLLFVKKEDRTLKQVKCNEPLKTPEKKLCREEWMLGDLDHFLNDQQQFAVSSSSGARMHGRKTSGTLDPNTTQRILQDKELNPFYANGGDGLPPVEPHPSGTEHRSLDDALCHQSSNTTEAPHPSSSSQVLPALRPGYEDSFTTTCRGEAYEKKKSRKKNDNQDEDDLNALALKQLKTTRAWGPQASEAEDSRQSSPRHLCASSRDAWQPYHHRKRHVNSYGGEKKQSSGMREKSTQDIDVLMTRQILRKGYTGEEEYDDLGGPLVCEKGRKEKKKNSHFKHDWTGKVQDTSQEAQKPLYQRGSKCLFCCTSALFSKIREPTMIAKSSNAYLCYETRQRCTLPIHCILFPRTHLGSSAQLDSQTYQEIRNFQKCLIQCLDCENYGVIFTECMTRKVDVERTFIGGGSHLVLECFGVPVDRFLQAKAYFRKALGDYGQEWSQNKKIIPVPPSSEGCRALLPVRFPYFYVDFGLGGGYLHLIEDNHFPTGFAQDILRGMMGIDPWHTHFSSSQLYDDAIADFKKKFTKYDWTRL